MGDSTDQQANQQNHQQADQQASQQAGKQAKKQAKEQERAKEKKWKRNERRITQLTALVALLALGASGWSLWYSSKQKTADQQDQLVKLTTAIAGQMAREQTASILATGKLTGAARSSAASNAIADITKLTVEGQAAAVLIDVVGDKRVTGMEYIEVAQALEVGGDIRRAIKYYDHALRTLPRDVPTRATALRYRGNLYYKLDQPERGHKDLKRAAEIFGEHPRVSQYYKATTVAQAYLMDAYWQISIKGKGCSVAPGGHNKSTGSHGALCANPSDQIARKEGRP
jgi:tetratricopeptide (TPR) repeat protein